MAGKAHKSGRVALGTAFRLRFYYDSLQHSPNALALLNQLEQADNPKERVTILDKLLAGQSLPSAEQTVDEGNDWLADFEMA